MTTNSGSRPVSATGLVCWVESWVTREGLPMRTVTMVTTMISQSQIRLVRVIERTLNGNVNIQIVVTLMVPAATYGLQKNSTIQCSPVQDTIPYGAYPPHPTPHHPILLHPTPPCSILSHPILSMSCHATPLTTSKEVSQKLKKRKMMRGARFV